MINKVKFLSILLLLVGLFSFSSCDNSCCAEEDTSEKKTAVTLTGIDVTQNPEKTLYIAGEKFEPAGMILTANYSDGTSKTIENGFSYSPTAALTESNTRITVSYTDSGITKSTEISITIGYKILLKTCTHGQITCEKTRAASKTSIKVTATPESDDYVLESLSYTWTESNGNPGLRDFNVENANEFVFDMPGYDIEISASFKEKLAVTKYTVNLNKTGESNAAKITLSSGGLSSTDSPLSGIAAGATVTISALLTDTSCMLAEIPSVSYTDTEKTNVVPVTVKDADAGIYTFTMPAHNVMTQVAIKKHGTYKLSVSKTGLGDVTLANSSNEEIVAGSYLVQGTKVTAKFQAGSGYEITSASFGEEKLEISGGQASFTMEEEDAVLTVLFSEKKAHKILFGTIANGDLKADLSTAQEGTLVTLTATPDDDYAALETLTITKNSDGDTVLYTKSDDGYQFVMPDSPVTISATFRGYEVVINDATGGSITSDLKYAKKGQKITLTATPAAENALKTVLIQQGENVLENNRSGNTVTFTMPEVDVVVNATFSTAISVTLAVNPATGGVVELYQGKTYLTLTNSTIKIGDGADITVLPTAGSNNEYIYEVGNVKVRPTNNSGEETTVTKENSSYHFSVPQHDVTIQVDFSLTNAKRLYIDGAISGGIITCEVAGTTVTSSSSSWTGGDAYIVKGKSVTVKAAADTGYTLSTLSVGKKVVEVSSGSYTFTMPESAVPVTATFTKKSYAVTFNSSVSNGAFTLSSGFTYNTSLKPDGTTYTSGAKIPYGETVYLIASAATNYTELLTVENTAEGSKVAINRLDSVKEPYQFQMPASDVTVTVAFEMTSSDVNLWVNDVLTKNFSLNPTPDKATWPTLEKEYYVQSVDASGNTFMGIELTKGQVIKVKDKNENILTSWEKALGFEYGQESYTVENDGIYKLYYKEWDDASYSMWITIPTTAALIDANYYLCVNGKNAATFAVSTSIDNVRYPTLVKQFYVKDVTLQDGDTVIINTSAAATAIPVNGILHWEAANTVGAEDGQPFTAEDSGKYDFYFKIWKDGGTSIWVEESKVTSN